MNNKQSEEIINMLGGLSLAYLNLALYLHDEGVVDKDVLAAKLKKSASRTGQDLPEEATTLLKKLAQGLETSKKV